MPSALSHPAVAVAARLSAGPKVVSNRLLLAAAAASVIPDLDVIGYWLGVPYDHPLGHRGFSHSIAFALLLAAAAAAFHQWLRASAKTTFLVVAIATASHGFLDGMTNGGLGIALLSPLSNTRFFLPWRPIVVSPLSIGAFLDSTAVSVLASEFFFVWLPCMALAAILLTFKASRRAG